MRIDVSALGTVVRIAPTDAWEAADLEALARAWSGASAGPDAVAGPVVEVEASLDEEALQATLASLSTRVTLAAIDANKDELLMLHAGGVADPSGRVIAYVGPSGRGKTTASRALGARFGYVSDETIGVADDGTVWPYRKPLSVIDPEQPGPKRQVSPAEAGLRDLPDAPLVLAACVLLDRQADGPDVPVVDDVAFADAVPDLVPQASHLATLPDALARLRAAVGERVLRIRYREASTLGDVVAELFTAAPVATLAPPRRYRAVRPHDAVLLDDGRIAVLSGAQVRVLDGIAPLLWQSLTVPRATDDLVALAVEHFGAPAAGDPVHLVAAALDELTAAGLVELGGRQASAAD